MLNQRKKELKAEVTTSESVHQMCRALLSVAARQASLNASVKVGWACDIRAISSADARRAWWQQIRDWQAEHPLTPEISSSEIKPQHVMVEVDRLAGPVDHRRVDVALDAGLHRQDRAVAGDLTGDIARV